MVPAMKRSLTAIAILALAAAAGACKKDEKKADKPATPADAAATRPAPPADAAAAEPDKAAIRTEEVTYKANGTELKGFLALPETASAENPVPGVLVVHEWWGHNEYTRERARMLAELGYAALAVDMYGEGKNTEHPEDAKKFMTEVMSKKDVAARRFEAARELLAKNEATDPEKMAAVGYCMGGAVVLNMARAGADLDAVAAFHAGSLTGAKPAKKGQVKAKVLVAHGGADPFVEAKSVPKFKEEMKKAGVDLRFVEYEGAKHAFTNPKATEMGKKYDLGLEYDPEADKQSWEELKKLLEEVWGA